MKNSLIILAFFAVGVALGISEKLPDLMMKTDFSMFALYGLMFLVGIGIGADRKSWLVMRKIKLKIFLVPLGVILGTLAGTAVISFLIPELIKKFLEKFCLKSRQKTFSFLLMWMFWGMEF